MVTRDGVVKLANVVQPIRMGEASWRVPREVVKITALVLRPSVELMHTPLSFASRTVRFIGADLGVVTATILSMSKK